MATETVTARELAVLVKAVRALLKQNKKIEAIKLVRKRTGCGLKESLGFVQHVQSWPGARAENVAKFWMNVTREESVGEAAEIEFEPVVTQECRADPPQRHVAS
jgi:ribosomal protein L7/L12